MSASSMDIERALGLWLSEGATVMPEGVSDLVADRIANTRQQKLRLPWPSLPAYQGERLLRTAALAAVVVVAAAIGFGLFASTIGPAKPTDSPTTTAAPSATPEAPASASPLPSPTHRSVLDELPVGTHQSNQWVPGMSFTVPAGWATAVDETQMLELATVARDRFVAVYSDVYPPTLDADGCPVPRDSIQPHGALDLVTSLTSDPDLSADAAPVTVGGLQGWLLTVTIKADARVCAADFSKTLFDYGSTPVAVGADLPLQLYVLDGRVDDTVVIFPEPSNPADDPAVAGLIDSFEFVLPASPGTGGPGPMGPINPGTHQTQVWAPTITFTVDEPWNSDWEDSSSMELFNVALGRRLSLYWNVYPPLRDDAGCPSGADWSLSHSAEDVVADIVSAVPEASSVEVTIGGLAGWRITGQAPSVTGDCFAEPFVVRGSDGAAGGSSFGEPGEAFRLFILDDTHGHAIGLVDETGSSPKIDALLETFSFNATCDTPPRTRLCEEPTDGVSQDVSRGELGVIVPEGALSESVATTVEIGDPANLPRVLRNAGYDLEYDVIGPENLDYAQPAHVSMGSAFLDFGIEQSQAPSEPLRPMVALATQRADGSWEWLANQQTRFDMHWTTTYADISHTGPVYRFLVGINNCGEWEPATAKGQPARDEVRGSTTSTVVDLGRGEPLLRRLGLGPVSMTVTRSLFFPPIC